MIIVEHVTYDEINLSTAMHMLLRVRTSSAKSSRRP